MNASAVRTKRVVYNTVTNLLSEAAAAASGLVISRLILSHLGSEYNGVTVSIAQFIACCALFSAGISGLTQAALYKPLEEGDTAALSSVMCAAESAMRKFAGVFAIILIALAALYPIFVRDEFDWVFVFTLVIILGAGTIIQLLLGAACQTLLAADQRGYIPGLANALAAIISASAAAGMIFAGGDIRAVKLTITVVFIIKPIFIYRYVRKKYKLNWSVRPDAALLRHRMDAFADQVSWFVYNHFDLVLITIFASMKEVSVYAVYYMIVRMVRLFIAGFGGSNIYAYFGSMLVKNEQERIRKSLRIYEFIINSLSSVLFVCAAVLTVPFVSVYTLGITDADYYRPLLAYLLCAAEFVTMFSFPYFTPVLAAGHFRQISKDAVAQICISIILSVVLIQYFGLAGAVIGKLCAMIFRTARYVIYMSRHVVKRSLWAAARNLLLTSLYACVTISITALLPGMGQITYAAWALYAVSVFGVASGVMAVFAGLFYREEVCMLAGRVWRIMRGAQ